MQTFWHPVHDSVLTSTYRQPRLPMLNELYVLAHSFVATPTSDGFLQDGVHLGRRANALRESLAHQSSVIPSVLQHFNRESV